MRVTKVTPVILTTEVKRRTKRNQYKSDIDPAVVIHSNRTHRTASEAFRDAEYATPIWRCETDWDKTKEYLKWIAMWLGTLWFLYEMAVWFDKAM
jgi:hypothetical protein